MEARIGKAAADFRGIWKFTNHCKEAAFCDLSRTWPQGVSFSGGSLRDTGSLVAAGFMTGKILPPLSCLTREGNAPQDLDT